MISRQNKFSTESITSINLDLSDVCNLKCLSCDRELYHKLNTGHIPINTLINTLSKFNLDKLILIGNISEPSLYKYIIELKRWLFDNNISVFMTTNGSASINIYKGLIDLALPDDQIYFCMDGSTPEIHQRYRVGSDLNKVKTKYQELQDYLSETRKDLTLGIQTLIFEHNQDDIQNIRNLYPKDKIILIEADVQNVTNVKSVKNQPLEKYQRFFKKNKRNQIICDCHKANFDNINITYNGTVYPCCYIMDVPDDIDIDNQEIFHGMKEYNIYTDNLDLVLGNLNKYMKEINYNKSCFLTCSKLMHQIK